MLAKFGVHFTFVGKKFSSTLFFVEKHARQNKQINYGVSNSMIIDNICKVIFRDFWVESFFLLRGA